eukprot:1180343-Prorocentrum_minimum.AAC.1
MRQTMPPPLCEFGLRRPKRPSSVVKSPLLRVKSPLLRVKSPLLRVNLPLLRVKSPLLRVNSPLLRVKSPLLRVKSPLLRVKSPLLRVNSGGAGEEVCGRGPHADVDAEGDGQGQRHPRDDPRAQPRAGGGRALPADGAPANYILDTACTLIIPGAAPRPFIIRVHVAREGAQARGDVVGAHTEARGDGGVPPPGGHQALVGAAGARHLLRRAGGRHLQDHAVDLAPPAGAHPGGERTRPLSPLK